MADGFQKLIMLFLRKEEMHVIRLVDMEVIQLVVHVYNGLELAQISLAICCGSVTFTATDPLLMQRWRVTLE